MRCALITGPGPFTVALPHFLEVLMGLFSLTRRVGQDAAAAVTGGAAALSGAATGAVNGATYGASHARGSGPRSPALAALVVAAIAAIGVTGVIEWPVLALGGVAALVLGQRRTKPASTPISSNAAPASSAGPSTASTAAIRDWARTNGHPVSPRGRLSADIVDAFNAAH